PPPAKPGLPVASERLSHPVVRHGLPHGRRCQPPAADRAWPRRAGLLRCPREVPGAAGQRKVEELVEQPVEGKPPRVDRRPEKTYDASTARGILARRGPEHVRRPRVPGRLPTAGPVRAGARGRAAVARRRTNTD